MLLSVQTDIQNKFTSNVDATEEKLKADTVGLVTLDRMKEKQMEFMKKGDDVIIGKEASPVAQERTTSTSKSVTRTAEV